MSRQISSEDCCARGMNENKPRAEPASFAHFSAEIDGAIEANDTAVTRVKCRVHQFGMILRGEIKIVVSTVGPSDGPERIIAAKRAAAIEYAKRNNAGSIAITTTEFVNLI